MLSMTVTRGRRRELVVGIRQYETEDNYKRWQLALHCHSEAACTTRDPRL